jgi:hypothetical protein
MNRSIEHFSTAPEPLRTTESTLPAPRLFNHARSLFRCRPLRHIHTPSPFRMCGAIRQLPPERSHLSVSRAHPLPRRPQHSHQRPRPRQRQPHPFNTLCQLRGLPPRKATAMRISAGDHSTKSSTVFASSVRLSKLYECDLSGSSSARVPPSFTEWSNRTFGPRVYSL